MGKKKLHKQIEKKNNKLQKQIEKLITSSHTYNITFFTNDSGHDLLNIDSNQTKIFTCKYNIMGNYNTQTNIFTWGYMFDLIDKTKKILAFEIKKYIPTISDAIIKLKYHDTAFVELMHYYVSNSMFYIDYKNINKLIGLASYITNTNIIYNKTQDVMNFYFITDIVTIYN